MSAPHTNIEKQEKQHKAPLLGMGAAVLWSGVLVVLLVGWLVWRGGSPDGAEVQIDGRTGDAVQTTTPAEAATTPPASN